MQPLKHFWENIEYWEFNLSRCKKIRIPKRRYCAADLNKKIVLQDRSISTPDDLDYGEDFDKLKTIWAGVKTLIGVEIFDENNDVVNATHDFIIHFRVGVTAENWILYKNNRYDILKVENFEERNEWLRLRSRLTGSDSKASTQA